MSLLPSRPDVSTADADPRVVDVDSDDADEVLAALSSKTARKLLSELHREPAPPGDLAERVDTSVQNVQYHLEKLQDAGAVQIADTAYSEKGREMDVYAPADQPLVIFAGDEDEGSTLKTALSRLLGSVGVLAAASVAVQAMFGESLVPWADDGVPDEPATADGAGEDSGGGADGDGGGGADGSGADVDSDATPEEATTDGGMTTESTPEDGFDAAGVTETPEGTPTPNATETPTPEGTPLPEVTPTPEEIQTTAEAATGLPPGVLFFAGGAFVLAVVVLVTYLR